MLWPACRPVRERSRASLSSSRRWTSGRRRPSLEGQSRKYSRMLSSFSYGKIKAYFLSRSYRQGVEVHQVNPAYSSVIGRVKFMERYGLTCPSGCGPGAGPSLARLFGAHLTADGFVRSAMAYMSPSPYPCKEAGEARVDVLGCDLGAAETGACSATPAGEAETRTQSGSGCRAWLKHAGWLERGSVRCSRVIFPGGAALNCWGSGAAETASSGMADGSLVTKVNHFYNGSDCYDNVMSWEGMPIGEPDF